MENAAKALLIAGGILISIIVVSIFILGYQKISEVQQKKVDNALLEEVTDFNEPFLTYNKKEMYGSDVISVINMAISNNAINDVKNKDDKYCVNIYIRLKTDCKNKITVNGVEQEFNDTSTELVAQTSLYSLLDDENQIKSFIENARNAEIIEVNNGIKTVKQFGVYFFKRLYFRCSKVEYDDELYVKSMTFTELKVNKGTN